MISLKSKITAKLLNYLFINPEEKLYVNELVSKLGVDKRNLAKKLKELEKEGILNSQIRGNLKFYSINKNYPLYTEYKRIIIKTMGLEEALRKILKETKGVKESYIYGSYAKDTMEVHSDIDLLVVGRHNVISLQKKLNKLQKNIDREINVINMDEQELKKRVKSKNPFILGILKGKHIRII